VNITAAAHAKISINKAKYPINSCHRNIQKYTAYSSMTNITKTSRQLINGFIYFDPTNDKENINDDYFFHELQLIKHKALQFTREREWDSYDTPKNLLFATNSELAELCEIFQWKEQDDATRTLSDNKWNQAAQEIADVLIYALKLENVITLQNNNVHNKKQCTSM
jgi:NTP pyrophosphatase (non-canonical NTP hydrolase)